jgi:DnaJ-related protein SCJ1
VKEATSSFVVELSKGCPESHILTVEGKGNEVPDMVPGDLKIRITAEPHPIFRREGSSLYMRVNLSLEEALFGFSKEVPHLDGSKIHLKRSAVTQPGFVDTLEDLGLPYFERPAYQGNLYVEYQVILPDLSKAAEKKKFESAVSLFRDHTEL